MTEMRRRMEEELKLRGCSPRTSKAYLAWMTRFAQHYRRPPEQAVTLDSGSSLLCSEVLLCPRPSPLVRDREYPLP